MGRISTIAIHRIMHIVTEDDWRKLDNERIVGDGTINSNNDNVLTVHVSNTSNAYISVDNQFCIATKVIIGCIILIVSTEH